MAEEKKETKEKKDRGRWFREMKSELKKVVWPAPQKTMKDTGTVLLFSFIVFVCIWLFDTGVGAAVNLLLGLAH